MDEKWETPELVEYGTAEELTEGAAAVPDPDLLGSSV